MLNLPKISVSSPSETWWFFGIRWEERRIRKATVLKRWWFMGWWFLRREKKTSVDFSSLRVFGCPCLICFLCLTVSNSILELEFGFLLAILLLPKVINSMILFLSHSLCLEMNFSMNLFSLFIPLVMLVIFLILFSTQSYLYQPLFLAFHGQPPLFLFHLSAYLFTAPFLNYVVPLGLLNHLLIFVIIIIIFFMVCTIPISCNNSLQNHPSYTKFSLAHSCYLFNLVPDTRLISTIKLFNMIIGKQLCIMNFKLWNLTKHGLWCHYLKGSIL